MSSSDRHHGAFLFLVRVCVFALLFVVVAEVWLRTLTPASEVPQHYQDATQKIWRFDGQATPDGLYTVGRLAHAGGVWRINSAGWNSAVDYSPPGAGRSLVAIFGDSYIEGFYTDVDEHVDAYLRHDLPATDVYAFGESSWYLEQYVATARYVGSFLRPDLLVVFVGEGDVADSLRENGRVSANLWQIRRDEGGGGFAEVPPPQIYEVSRKLRLAKASALVRYLRYNALVALPGMGHDAAAQPAADAGPQGPAGSGERPDAWKELLPAARFMLATIRREHPGVPVLFVAHQRRRYLTPAQVAAEPLFDDAQAIRAASHDTPDCWFLDLRGAFARDWVAHHTAFEASDGAHWNPYANALVARTVAAYIRDHRLIKPTP